MLTTVLLSNAQNRVLRANDRELTFVLVWIPADYAFALVGAWHCAPSACWLYGARRDVTRVHYSYLFRIPFSCRWPFYLFGHHINRRRGVNISLRHKHLLVSSFFRWLLLISSDGQLNFFCILFLIVCLLSAIANFDLTIIVVLNWWVVLILLRSLFTHSLSVILFQ